MKESVIPLIQGQKQCLHKGSQDTSAFGIGASGLKLATTPVVSIMLLITHKTYLQEDGELDPEDDTIKIKILYVSLGFKDHSKYTLDRARTPIKMSRSGVRLPTLF